MGPNLKTIRNLAFSALFATLALLYEPSASAEPVTCAEVESSCEGLDGGSYQGIRNCGEYDLFTCCIYESCGSADFCCHSAPCNNPPPPGPPYCW